MAKSKKGKSLVKTYLSGRGEKSAINKKILTIVVSVIVVVLLFGVLVFVQMEDETFTGEARATNLKDLTTKGKTVRDLMKGEDLLKKDSPVKATEATKYTAGFCVSGKITDFLCEVPFKDPKLKARVKSALKLPFSQKVTFLSATKATILDLSNQNTPLESFSNIQGLEFFTELTYLDLSYNKVSNIDALSSLTKLQTLHLIENQISDIDALSSLTNLQNLILNGNKIWDIEVLSNLKKLNVLGLVGLNFPKDQLASLAPLKELGELQSLSIMKNNNLPKECQSEKDIGYPDNAPGSKQKGKAEVKTFLDICIPSFENCKNGIDDDSDGKSDCEDVDCNGYVWLDGNPNLYQKGNICANGKKLTCGGENGDVPGGDIVEVNIVKDDYSQLTGQAFTVYCYYQATTAGAKPLYGPTIWAECNTNPNGWLNTKGNSMIKGSTWYWNELLDKGVIFREGETINQEFGSFWKFGSFLCHTPKVSSGFPFGKWDKCDADAEIDYYLKGELQAGLMCYEGKWQTTKETAAQRAGILCETDSDCAVPELRCWNLRDKVGMCDYAVGETVEWLKAKAYDLDENLLLYGDKVRIKTVHNTYWRDTHIPSLKVGYSGITVPGFPIILANSYTPDAAAEFQILDLSIDGSPQKSKELVRKGDLIVLRSLSTGNYVGISNEKDSNGINFLASKVLSNGVGYNDALKLRLRTDPSLPEEKVDTVLPPKKFTPLTSGSTVFFQLIDNNNKPLTALPPDQGQYKGDVKSLVDNVGSWEWFTIEHVK